MRAFLVFLAAGSLLVGCTTEQEDCTAIAAVSVAATVVDADGHPVGDAVVTYLAEGADTPETCEEIDDTFLCGYEVSGDILIRAEADGYQPAEQTVTVTEDECHVNGEFVELVMYPLDCPDIENVSVLVRVLDPAGATIPDAKVEYAPECEDWTDEEECEPTGTDQWACGWEFTCPIHIAAEAPGYQRDSAIVDPDEDECGVITAEHVFVLEPDV